MHKYMFFDRHVHIFMSRTAIIPKFKMCLFLNEACSWAEKFFTEINLPPLMPAMTMHLPGLFWLSRKGAEVYCSSFPSREKKSLH